MANPPSFFFPSEGFTFTRSYIYGFNVRHDGAAPDLVDNVLQFTLAGSPPAFMFVTINEKFIPWSSNHFNLADVFEDCYYIVGGVEHHESFPWDVGYIYDVNDPRGTLHVNVHFGGSNSTTPLPSQPPETDYWLPGLT